MKLKLAISTLALAAVLTTTVAFAKSLESYKSEGIIGETTTGLVAAVTAAPSADLKAVIKDINLERLEKYKDVAEKNGLTIGQVQKLAAKKLYSQTPKGHWVQDSSGDWTQK